MWDGLRNVVAETLAPTRCAGCERPGDLVCPDCLAALEPIDPRESCLWCGAPFGATLCTECRGEERDERVRVLAAVCFSGPAPRIVRAYKDGGERRLAGPIAEMMLDAACHAEQAAPERFAGMLERADAVTFVPATAAAMRRRGFDHMEHIARAFGGAAGVVISDVLAKRGAADQRALGRAGRLREAQGAYVVVGDVAEARLVLLDDVSTTGATIHAAARALMRAGACAVDAVVFARVW